MLNFFQWAFFALINTHSHRDVAFIIVPRPFLHLSEPR